MNRKKMRDLGIVFFVGLFLMTKEIVFIWMLGFVFILFSSTYSRPKSKKRKRYLSDAEERGIKIPASHSIHQRLDKVYQKAEASKKRQPAIAESFDEIIEDLWENLAIEDRMQAWREILDDVLDEWPEKRKELRASLEKKIKTVQELSDQWSEARAEVYGK